MRIIKIVLLLVTLLISSINLNAQGVRLYKTDGTVIKVSDAELDSIVSMYVEHANKVYKTDGTVLKILYSELDSIVGVSDNKSGTVFVDLGLSVMWAANNIGAERPEDYGDYFAWGEINTKSSYDKENSLSTGKEMGVITGDVGYDAARANCGVPARIPTSEEYNELRSKCNWEWTLINGVGGQLVTGPNGNSIFLPAAGLRRGTALDDAGESGIYWSASPYEDHNGSAYTTLFNDSGYWGSMRSRSDGLTIRPVAGDIQCISYTGDTLKVGETSADISVIFSFVPAEGIIGGVEYFTLTSEKREQTMEIKTDGEYVFSISGLDRGTKYKYRSFVIENGKYIYGATEEFITKNNEDNLTKGEWIDLGLSVKWASHNVGAMNPEDYGDYYAWGEIYPKQSYDVESSITTGKNMNDISGNSDYDAASANWGNSARMPTSEELNELLEKCTWEWIPRNGVNGMLVTGPNGNRIFLPAAGFRIGPALDGIEMNGFYWSSTPSEESLSRAFGLSFSKNGPRGSWNNRDNGRTIRAVSN